MSKWIEIGRDISGLSDEERYLANAHAKFLEGDVGCIPGVTARDQVIAMAIWDRIADSKAFAPVFAGLSEGSCGDFVTIIGKIITAGEAA